LDFHSTVPHINSSIINKDVLDMPLIHLIFHCGNVFEEMIKTFKTIDKQKCSNITIELILPNSESEKGLDAGGVFRDTRILDHYV